MREAEDEAGVYAVTREVKTGLNSTMALVERQAEEGVDPPPTFAAVAERVLELMRERYLAPPSSQLHTGSGMPKARFMGALRRARTGRAPRAPTA